MDFFLTSSCSDWKATGDCSLEASSLFCRYNNKSVKWDWQGPCSIEIPVDISLKSIEHGINANSFAAFSFWVYSEAPKFGKLKFEFGHENQVDCFFEYRLNFTGWRTGWILYRRDMHGEPGDHLDFIRISPPESEVTGTLYFDQMIGLTYIDSRLPVRDAQMPGLDVDDDYCCWSETYKVSQYSPVPELPFKVEVDTFNTVDGIEQSIISILLENMPHEQITDRDQAFSRLGLKMQAGKLHGPPPVLPSHNLIIPPKYRSKYSRFITCNSLDEYFKVLWGIALKMRYADDEQEHLEFENLFVTILDYMQDQGWQPGSGMGTLKGVQHSLGIFAVSLLIVKSSLRKRKRLAAAGKMLRWLAGTGRIYSWQNVGVCASLDVTGLLNLPIIVSILLDDSTRDKVRDLTAFSRWYSKVLEPAPGLFGTIKEDGSLYHNYGPSIPIYSGAEIGRAFAVMTSIAGTDFDISGVAWKSFSKNLFAINLMASPDKLPIFMNGSAVEGYHKVKPSLMYMLALAALRKGDMFIAERAGGGYLRLTAHSKDLKIIGRRERLLAHNIYLHNAPEGHWNFNYSCLAVQRSSGWIAAVKGFSRYVMRAEIKADSNLFGRYISFGQLEILPEDDNLKMFRHDGWNWNFWPGVTAILKPVNALRADIRISDDNREFEEKLLSSEAFAGGVRLDHNDGCFGLSLAGHPKYECEFRARKSYFFVDDFILCLGSSISAEDDLYPVFTCLFQTPIGHEKNTAPLLNGSKLNVSRIDGCGNSETWMTDSVGNSYYLPAGDFTLTVGNSQSMSHDGTRATRGKFACAWIDHGIAPRNEEYEYVVFPQNIGNVEKFIKDMSSQRRPYHILRKDSGAHIVKFNARNIISYIMFRAGPTNSEGPVITVNQPSLIMTRKTASTFKLSMCCPDLNLYEGEDSDQFDSDGKQKEVSIRSRQWFGNYSHPLLLRIELKGEWAPRSKYDFCKSCKTEGALTTVEIECHDAQIYQMEFELL